MDTAGKPITCKAAIAWEPKKPLTIETVEVAPPKAHEVRIKVVANGICHSDLSIIDGKSWNPYEKWPMILGHEGAGIVESVGEGVTDLYPGDHVIPLWNPQCKECAFCKSLKTNQCTKLRKTQALGLMPDGTTRFTCNGKPVYHFMGTSTLSNYTVVADISVAKIDPEAPLDKVCIFGCGLSTGYGAALNTAKVDAGSTCAVWGLGAVGLATVMGCRKAGAARIIGVDINPDKFDIAKKFGATECVNPKDHEKPIETVLVEMTGGCDFTFECIGNVATMKSAIVSARGGGGRVTIVGISPAAQEISFSPLLVVTGRTLVGSIFGDWKGDDVPRLVDEYMNKEVMLDEFITHTMPLDKVNEAFDILIAGKRYETIGYSKRTKQLYHRQYNFGSIRTIINFE